MPETHNDVTRVWIYVEIRIYSQAAACESYKVWPQTHFFAFRMGGQGELSFLLLGTFSFFRLLPVLTSFSE